MTEILPANPETISQAAKIIQVGGLVAFPTETVYGLGANALDATAVARIFVAKDRPASDPLIVHVSSLDQINRIARSFSHTAQTLAKAFWPGPLTLILPKQPAISDLVTSGRDNVAVRFPNHPVALALIEASETPVAAPSANRFGHTSPTTAQHVFNDLAGRIDLILDGGKTRIGVESTVLDLSTTPARILRPGGITREMLEELVGPLEVIHNVKKSSRGLPSPGLLDKHYAPRAEMILFRENAREKLKDFSLEQLSLGKKIGALLTEEEAAELEHANLIIYRLGRSNDLDQIAHHIYSGLRWLDDQKVDMIVCHDFGESGIALAIRDRLTRAATRIIA